MKFLDRKKVFFLCAIFLLTGKSQAANSDQQSQASLHLRPSNRPSATYRLSSKPQTPPERILTTKTHANRKSSKQGPSSSDQERQLMNLHKMGLEPWRDIQNREKKAAWSKIRDDIKTEQKMKIKRRRAAEYKKKARFHHLQKNLKKDLKKMTRGMHTMKRVAGGMKQGERLRAMRKLKRQFGVSGTRKTKTTRRADQGRMENRRDNRPEMSQNHHQNYRRQIDTKRKHDLRNKGHSHHTKRGSQSSHQTAKKSQHSHRSEHNNQNHHKPSHHARKSLEHHRHVKRSKKTHRKLKVSKTDRQHGHFKNLDPAKLSLRKLVQIERDVKSILKRNHVNLWSLSKAKVRKLRGTTAQKAKVLWWMEHIRKIKDRRQEHAHKEEMKVSSSKDTKLVENQLIIDLQKHTLDQIDQKAFDKMVQKGVKLDGLNWTRTFLFDAILLTEKLLYNQHKEIFSKQNTADRAAEAKQVGQDDEFFKKNFGVKGIELSLKDIEDDIFN